MVNKNILINLYYQKKWTLQMIGKKYKVTRERIRQVMDQYNLPRDTKRSGGRTKKWKSLDDYFQYIKNGGKEHGSTLFNYAIDIKKQCELCRNINNLHIHHKRYPATSLYDIQILCASCHWCLHRSGNGRKEQLLICRKYIEGLNGVELAKEYGVTPGRIYHILKKWNVNRRPTGSVKVTS